MLTIDFKTFAIKVKSSPETNDHEVRLLGDDDELIDRFWEGMIGLDPDDILLEPSPIRASAAPHSATVARCDCGVISCGSVEVMVRSEGDKVLWVEGDRTLRFRAEQYAAELHRAQVDTSWETTERTAARLVRERVDRQLLAGRGLTFEWASGRTGTGRFTVSLRLDPGPYQVLVSVPCANETPEELAYAALHMLERDPQSWDSVRYLPQQTELGAPPLNGPGWKRGPG
jgi:hypothetical protein